jgi:hypothetical protein
VPFKIRYEKDDRMNRRVEIVFDLLFDMKIFCDFTIHRRDKLNEHVEESLE